MGTRYWTEHEVKTLTEIYTTRKGGAGRTIDYKRLIDVRSKQECQKKASRLRLTKWFNESVIDYSTWTGAEIGYLAGLIDGEGCISFTERLRNGRTSVTTVRLIITNTHIGLMEWLKARIMQACYFQERRSNNIKRKPAYSFVMSAAPEVLQTLEVVFPYLIVKKAKAVEAIAILKEMIARRAA